MSNQVQFDHPAVSRHAQRSVTLALMVFVFMFLFSAVKAAAAASSPASHFTQAAATSIHTAAGSLSLSFPSTTTAGDVILVAFDYTGNATAAAVTDSQGNAFSIVGVQMTSPGRTHSVIYYAKSIKGGADTVTVHLTANSSVIELYLAEYSGLNSTSPIDAHVGATGSTSAVSSGAAATTVVGDIIFGYCIGDRACTAGAGFATRSTMDGNLIEDMVAGKPGAYAATGSATSTWTMKMVALRPATGPATSLSPSTLSFSSPAVGTASGAQAVTLSNTGTAALSVSSLALAGTNASDFTQTNNCGSLVAAGANCLVSVTFKPAASGSRTASLSISDNASGSPQTVSLSGMAAAAVASLSPSSLTFGNEPVGTTSSAQVVTLNNTGNTALSITSIAFTGANATDFTQADTCGASVAAGGNCTIAIMFTPSATGARVASLSITDSASGSPQPVSLSGTGTQTAPTGHTYYVDNCVVIGSDANNGTSPTTPWLTINKVNTSTFNPGDSILFESTCTWREQLTVPSSGSAGSPITFGAYGTGAKPIISGANLLTSWVSETTLYYASALVQPNQVFLDGQRLALAASKAALATGDWWWDSTNNRIYVYDDPSGHTIEASQRGAAIYGASKSYITISGLEIDESNGGDGLFCAPCNNLTVSNVALLRNYEQGMLVGSSTGVIITQSTAAYNGATGFEADTSPGVLLDRLIAHDNAELTTVNYTAGIRLYDGTGVSTNDTVQYCLVYNNGVGQPSTGIDAYGLGIWADTVGSGFTAKYNLVYGNNEEGIRAEADTRVSIVGNVVYNTVGCGTVWCGGIDLAGDQSAFAPMSNSVVSGNTVYGGTNMGIILEGPGVASGCMNNSVTNNIVVGNTYGALNAYTGCENPGTNGSGNTYTHNDFGVQASDFIEWGASLFSAYSAWEAAPGNCGTVGCSNSVQADPQFVNASAAKFWLQPTSPAIDAGTNLGSPYNIGLLPGSSWPTSVLTGDQNSYGSRWELGAYIFTGQTVQ